MFNIVYRSNNTDTIRHSTTMEAACVAAYNHMAMHPEISQASIVDALTGEVARVYMRG